MSQLINDTIEAYNLYLEGELSIEELEYGIESGLISESLLLELETTLLEDEEMDRTKVMLHNQRNATFAKLDRHLIRVDKHVKKIDTHSNPTIKEKLHNKITQDAMKNITEKSKTLRSIRKEINNMKDKSESKAISARLRDISKGISAKENEYNSHMAKHF